MKLSDLVEDADSECLDLGTDGSSSEEEKCEDTEKLLRLFDTSAVRSLPKNLCSALKTFFSSTSWNTCLSCNIPYTR